MFRTLNRFIVVAAVLSFAPGVLVAQEAPASNPVREKYTKHEFKIKMRDGLYLFTSVYTPKDTSKSYRS
ncbi:MAG: hypothetical protein ABI672_19870 [Vicinamibacteria bacterium]